MRNFLILNFRQINRIFKINITGPESAGKSTLSASLASHYKDPRVEEYARVFLNRGQPILEVRTLIDLAHIQIEWENTALRNAERVIFCDTDPLVLLVWALEKFGKTPPELVALARHHRYDLTLLCKPDLDWEPDPLRENPYDRDRLFDQYLDFANKFQLNYTVIDGRGETRLKNALAIVDPFIKQR